MRTATTTANATADHQLAKQLAGGRAQALARDAGRGPAGAVRPQRRCPTYRAGRTRPSQHPEGTTDAWGWASSSTPRQRGQGRQRDHVENDLGRVKGCGLPPLCGPAHHSAEPNVVDESAAQTD